MSQRKFTVSGYCISRQNYEQGHKDDFKKIVNTTDIFDAIQQTIRAVKDIYGYDKLVYVTTVTAEELVTFSSLPMFSIFSWEKDSIPCIKIGINSQKTLSYIPQILTVVNTHAPVFNVERPCNWINPNDLDK